jgi:hypothetical protein
MIHRVGLSASQCSTARNLALRASLALTAASFATGALAQTVTQSLTVNFSDGTPVPIGGWAAIGIALLVAAAAGLVLRRSSSSRAWMWVTALFGTAGVFALQPIHDVHAGIPMTSLDLVTNPAVVVFTFPGAPGAIDVQVANKSGAPTTILAIALASGPYHTIQAIVAPCIVGMVLPRNGICNVKLGRS